MSKQWGEKVLKCHLLVAHIQIPPEARSAREGSTLRGDEFRKWKVTNFRTFEASLPLENGLILSSLHQMHNLTDLDQSLCFQAPHTTKTKGSLICS
jgi:hypothetical protein